MSERTLPKAQKRHSTKLADKLAQFLESMPPFELESHKLARQAEQFVNAERHRSRAVAHASTKKQPGQPGVAAPEEKTR